MCTQEGINVPIRVYVAFQQSDRQHDQNLNNDLFARLPVISAQVAIGKERYPDTAILIKYDDDEYSQGYGQIKEALRALTKDDILQPYKTKDDFRLSNVGDCIGYNIHAFDIKKKFESGQSVKVEFKFDGVVPAGVYGYALVLINRLVSINSDGQRMCDLT